MGAEQGAFDRQPVGRTSGIHHGGGNTFECPRHGVEAKQPGVVFRLGRDHLQHVSGIEPGIEYGSIIADRPVRDDAIDLPARVGIHGNIGVDAAQRGTGNLRIGSCLGAPAFPGGAGEHVPTHQGAQAIGKNDDNQQDDGDLAQQRVPPPPGQPRRRSARHPSVIGPLVSDSTATSYRIAHSAIGSPLVAGGKPCETLHGGSIG